MKHNKHKERSVDNLICTISLTSLALEELIDIKKLISLILLSPMMLCYRCISFARRWSNRDLPHFEIILSLLNQLQLVL